MITDAIAQILNRANLTQTEAEGVMSQIMAGDATPAQIGAYLIALRMKGETVDEVTGSARSMRAHALRVSPHVNGDALFDVVGTGGDGAQSFNISTTAAFVVAGTGRKVAKHGNRAASSRCGSADVLAELGVSLDLTPEQVVRCIDEVGIGFLFAPRFHPAMRHAIGPRRELKQRTIFNVLGPLTNPAGATHLFIGVYDPALTEPMARVAGELGAQAATVVHGHGGLDELTPSGPNRISRLKSDGTVDTRELSGRELGLSHAPVESLRGGEPADNAATLRGVLDGSVNGARKDTVLFNAAAAIATETDDLPDGLREARQSLESGAALAKLEALVELSSSFAAAL